MCSRLSDLRDGLQSWAASFDAALLTVEQAGVVVREAAAIERMASVVKGLAARRCAEAGSWKAAGERSAAHELARATGTSVAGAREVLETARRLEALPVVAASALAGQLSAAQVAAVADAASADPSATTRLLSAAGSSSLAELREECARTKAAVGDPEARRKAIHARRCLRTYTDSEGIGHLHLSDNPERVAQVMAAVTPLRDRLFKEARAEGRREPSEAYAADALVALVSGRSKTDGPAVARAKLLVRVDLAALLRGRVVDGETCEIAGFGPVAVSAVRELIDTADPFLAAVVTKGKQVVGVAHLGRRPTALQQSALEWLYPTCAAEGCSASTWLENDHRVDWSMSKITVFDLLDRLCSHHHDRKTLDNWSLVDGRGKRAFVPPDDPRHPRHSQACA